MRSISWKGSVGIACAAWVVVLGVTSTACARDAYWAGLNGQDWNVGFNAAKTISIGIATQQV